jgi:hypothetical protein
MVGESVAMLRLRRVALALICILAGVLSDTLLSAHNA